MQKRADSPKMGQVVVTISAASFEDFHEKSRRNDEFFRKLHFLVVAPLGNRVSMFGVF